MKQAIKDLMVDLGLPCAWLVDNLLNLRWRSFAGFMEANGWERLSYWWWIKRADDG